MAPLYLPGMFVVGRRWFLRLRSGQVVVVRTSARSLLKRVKRVGQEGVWVEGDNPKHSRDSRQLGFINRRDIEAVVIRSLRNLS